MDQAGGKRELTPGATVTPAPAWVDLSPYTIPATANPHFIASGVCVLLDDSQIDLCGPERAWYYRRADMVTAPAGAERVAQFSVAFDPAFERLEVHSVCVIRGGQKIEHADEAEFDVLRRERNMENMHLDGRLTVAVTLPDVRQGDVVESSYTIYGMRKSLGGRHSTWIPLEWPVGIVEVRIRQRRPKDRTVAENAINGAPQATETEQDGIVDRRWHTVERPGKKFEGLAPPWVVQGAALQLSEWREWAEVAETFAPLYEDTGALPADLEAEIARIEQSEATPAARAAAILRFAQTSVRYLAISMGEGGYTPRSISDVCETRYGDCKDKSKLYTLMARRLGLDACPALVNTRDGYAIDKWLPTAHAFDHCIVRVTVDGKTYWLDPTRSRQASPLETMAQCYYGFALPLKAGVKALEKMGTPPIQHTVQTQETVTLGPTPETPVKYEWKNTYRGVRAEGVRETLEREGAVGFFKMYAEELQRAWPGAAPVKQEVVSDNVAENTITILESYEVSNAWRSPGEPRWEFATLDLTMNRIFAALDAGPRSCEIYLGHPGRFTRVVEINTAIPLNAHGWTKRYDSSEASFVNDLRRVTPQKFMMEQTCNIRSLTLPAKEAEAYRTIQKELSNSEVVISEVTNKKGKFVADKRSGGGGGGGGSGSSTWTVLGIVLVLAAIVARVLISIGEAP